MKVYRASGFGAAFVHDGAGMSSPLSPRLDLRRHSIEGFAWGCNYEGCAQLALAILCDAYDDDKALRHYRQFAALAIATANRDAPFQMKLDEVMSVVEMIEQETTP